MLALLPDCDCVDMRDLVRVASDYKQQAQASMWRQHRLCLYSRYGRSLLSLVTLSRACNAAPADACQEVVNMLALIDAGMFLPVVVERKLHEDVPPEVSKHFFAYLRT